MFMKKMSMVAVFLSCGLAIFAQTPSYTTERLQDGTLVYIFPTENDAMLYLTGNYGLPETCWIAVLLRGIYLSTDNPLIPNDHSILEGTRLVTGNGGPLGGLVTAFYNLNRNTEYYVFWKREYDERMSRITMLPGGSGRPVYVSMVMVIADNNFNPLTPVRR
jgi:hypothetical protein